MEKWYESSRTTRIQSIEPESSGPGPGQRLPGNSVRSAVTGNARVDRALPLSRCWGKLLGL